MHRPKFYAKVGRLNTRQESQQIVAGFKVDIRNMEPPHNQKNFHQQLPGSATVSKVEDLYPWKTEQKRSNQFSEIPLTRSQVYPNRQYSRQKSFKIGETRIQTSNMVLLTPDRYAKESQSGSNSPDLKRDKKPSTLSQVWINKQYENNYHPIPFKPRQNNYQPQNQVVLETIKINPIETEDSLSHCSQKLPDNQSDHSFEGENKVLNMRPMILQSLYADRPPTIFFQYPAICEQKRQQVRARFIAEEDEKKYSLTYRVLGQIPYKCVTSAFESAGFKRFDEDDEENDNNWNVMWGMGTRKTTKNMNKYQKINHFPGCWHLGRKDNLWMNLSKMKRKHPKDYDFIPNTYLLAYDYDRFLSQREQASKHSLWIMKPCASARGRGIRMISKKSKVSKKKNYLVMDYISNPHLINGFKYDLRVYVLISGFDPLRVYIYNEGLVRFATEPYSVSHKDLSKKYIHLTNFAVNKNSPNFIKNQNSNLDGQGSKWSHTALRRQYSEMQIDHQKLFDEISDVVLKTCIASEPFMLDSNAKSPDHKNGFFELYGFDVLIDQDLKPWVLEANVCPSLNSASPLDKKIKTALISDIMHLVGVPLWDKSKKKSSASLNSPVKQSLIFSKNINDIPTINYSNCLLKLTPEDWNQILTFKEEQSRCGNFRCIYPCPETISYYQPLFEFQRYNNKLIERFFQDGQKWIDRFK